LLTAIGALGLIPAMILVVTGLLGWAQPKALVYPVVVMGGLALALAVSFIELFHWEFHKEPGSLRVTCRIRTRAPEVFLFLLGVLLLGIIAGYSFLENFRPR